MLFPKRFSRVGFVAIIVAMIFISAKKDSGKSVIIYFENFVGNELLKMDSASYKNELGQSYNISKFKYYISKIILKNKKGNEFISNSFFLVNEDNKDSKKIILANIPDLDFSTITFTVGVDSIHNCSGIQSGVLDPINGMFWAWNTGYVFLKLEGHAVDSKSPGNIFEYHIGGFKSPANCIRKITLQLNDSSFTKANSKDVIIKIKTDINQLFKTPTSIDFSKLSSVTDFNNAETIADNYNDMFTILETTSNKIENEK